MGYVHMHRMARPFTDGEWLRLTDLVRRMLATDACPRVAYEDDQPERVAEVSPDAIRFNGVPLGHETFLLRKSDDTVFTKTGRKPYDAAVTATLILAEMVAPGALDISSDGYTDEWTAGLDLARKVLPDAKIPDGINDYDG